MFDINDEVKVFWKCDYPNDLFIKKEECKHFVINKKFDNFEVNTSFYSGKIKEINDDMYKIHVTDLNNNSDYINFDYYQKSKLLNKKEYWHIFVPKEFVYSKQEADLYIQTINSNIENACAQAKLKLDEARLNIRQALNIINSYGIDDFAILYENEYNAFNSAQLIVDDLGWSSSLQSC